MTTEYAKNPHRGQRDIEDVGAFRQHLKRKGLRNLSEWEARQARDAAARRSPDPAAEHEHLTLQARYVALKAKR